MSAQSAATFSWTGIALVRRNPTLRWGLVLVAPPRLGPIEADPRATPERRTD